MSRNQTPMSRSTAELRAALCSLIGAGAVTIAGCERPAPTPAGNGGAVTVSAVAQPKNVIVPTPKEWKRVQIELTEAQRADLQKQGVDISKLDITTYDISQLGAQMVN